MNDFEKKVAALRAHHEELLSKKNQPLEWGNGIYEKYANPILTAEHTPLEWRYDFNEKDNPFLMQRIMMNATLNSGAMKWGDKYVLVVRVEGADRKSFFAVAESPNGIDNFRFWEEPITMPDDEIPATNIYDMRITQHEDGWIYGVFCAERHDDSKPGDLDKKMAEYALAVVAGRPHFHISIVMDVSPFCDCHGENVAPIVPNLGMFASFDPVALDQACADAVNAAPALGGSVLADHLTKHPHGDHFTTVSPDTNW